MSKCAVVLPFTCMLYNCFVILERSCGDLYEYYDDRFDVMCANTFEGTECSISCSHFLYRNEGSSTALCQLQDNGEVAWVYDNDEPPYCAGYNSPSKVKH